MYARTLTQALQTVSTHFPVVLLTGPRQVGKTTLLELCAANQAQVARNYVTLDDLSARQLAQTDPALFLQTWPAPVTIDEVQYAPALFSAIKLAVDRQLGCNGLFWLTGSQKFHLMRGITESLAGRVAVLDLLGFSQAETCGRAALSRPFLPTAAWLAQARPHAQALPLNALFEQIWLGAFPRLHPHGGVVRDVFYRSYIQTYIQRDVQDVLRISDQTAFHRFLTAVAARTGQLLNMAALARDVDVDNKTAKAWLSVLEASGLVYLLQQAMGYSQQMAPPRASSTPIFSSRFSITTTMAAGSAEAGWADLSATFRAGGGVVEVKV
jgi:predicted AAA+ superfamily ATPase